MGIKLDWQVESEQTQLHATEDPEAKRRRRRARGRLLLVVIVLAGALLLLAASLLWRLNQVDVHYRDDLLDTVEIEVTALRLGDFANYMAIQRSASDAFLLEQSREFEAYQQLKQAHRVELTGKVLDVEIDTLRGRVVVEEIIDGVPYKVVWFYWYYEDSGPDDQGGWRRVPDDLEFWGDEQEITNGPVRITYHDLDADLASALAPRARAWWTRGCELVQCATPPPSLHLDIVAEKPTAVEWTTYDAWTLRVTSPLIGRARADLPISSELEQAIIQQIAVRLVRYAAGDVPPIAHSDATWLYAEAARWLGDRLSAGDSLAATDTGFLGTLIAGYGATAPGTVLRVLRPDSTLDGVLSVVTGVSLPLLSVDQLNALNWQDFFQWRLALESRLLSQPDSGGAFLTLYDLENLTAANEASLRLEDPAYAARPTPQVGAVTITRDENGQTYAYVETTRTEHDQIVSETIIWRLASGTWKRVS